MATLRGKRFDDYLSGTEADDDIFGAQGNDEIYGRGGLDLIRGGRGDDQIELNGMGRALGGVGNDSVSGEGGTLGGGPGHDLVYGSGGDMYGDAVPGERSSRKAGNDTMISFNAAGETTQTGGAGNDTHIAQLCADGIGGATYVLDFTPGVDHVAATLIDDSDSGYLFPGQTFAVLDTNGNGVLGDDTPWDGNSQVFSDVANDRLVIRLHEDYLVVDGVTKLTVADWAFDY